MISMPCRLFRFTPTAVLVSVAVWPGAYQQQQRTPRNPKPKRSSNYPDSS